MVNLNNLSINLSEKAVQFKFQKILKKTVNNPKIRVKFSTPERSSVNDSISQINMLQETGSSKSEPKFKAFQGSKVKSVKKFPVLAPLEKPCLINLKNIEFVHPKPLFLKEKKDVTPINRVVRTTVNRNSLTINSSISSRRASTNNNLV